MRKLISILLLLVFQLINAQNTVKGSFTNTDVDIQDIALYRVVKGGLDYIKYVEVKNKEFTFTLENLPAGNYRALYQNIKTGYVDFIYNHENVVFSVNSKVGQPSVEFLESRENQLLYAYNYNINLLQHKLDSIQIAYFSKPSSNTENYKDIYNKVTGAQAYYENLASNDYCYAFIKASKRHNAPLPFVLPNKYLGYIIDHFFDDIDFKNQKLENSIFIKDRLKSYVFHLHQTDDVVQQNELYKKSIRQILSKTTDNSIKEDILHFFMPEFTIRENKRVLSNIIDLYEELPDNIQDKKLIEETKNKLKTLIGSMAPDFKISDTETLRSLQDSNQYLVVFWSSGCTHCAEELPMVKELLKNNNDITVITVGLEEERSQENWKKTVSENFQGWKNVMSLGMWDSELAVLYDIHATPSYFLLNKNKYIIAKPDDFKELQECLK